MQSKSLIKRKGNERKTHYFYPNKESYYDYNCNLFAEEIKSVKKEWYEVFNPLIEREENRIEKPSELVAVDDSNFQ